MSDTTVAAPGVITFGNHQVRMIEVLRSPDFPKAALEDFDPDQVLEFRRQVQFGLNAPITDLMRKECFVVPVRPSSRVMQHKKREVVQNIARSQRTQKFTSGRLEVSLTEAEYLLQAGFHSIDVLHRIAHEVKKWDAEPIESSRKTMAGELLSSPDGWAWWLDKVVEYEGRKLSALRRQI